jgi:dedicated sortase system histidine kinase
MNLRRQLLLVSLLTLVLPWAGCEFIRETETALREGQQDMLGGTAQAIADSLSQFPTDFFRAGSDGTYRGSEIYGHPLSVEPLIDGYTDDWTLTAASTRSLRGADGETGYRVGVYRQYLFLAIEVRDSSKIRAAGPAADGDRVELVTQRGDGARERYVLASEAPGKFMGRRRVGKELTDESRIQAYWLDTPHGYRIEARLPLEMAGDHFGFTVVNERGDGVPVRSATYTGDAPGRFITLSPVLVSVIRAYARDDLRLIVTDRAGWRLAEAGQLARDVTATGGAGAGWLRLTYNALLEPGQEGSLEELDPQGRERQAYVVSALNGDTASAWFRSAETGRAVVAVARPVWSGNVQTGAVILQQGTAAILSLTNAALGRLVSFTLIATLAVALALIGYASWLSLRIRRLSKAAESALEEDPSNLLLPSSGSGDEIGDLSRSFSSVLQQLGNYNDYLRTLASKLSHELRTPLAIVNSSLENLEHEPLGEDAARYTARARDGTARLKKILDAMSEAQRVEELMQSIEPERFDLVQALTSATEAYADAWPERRFSFHAESASAAVLASPELLMQLVDKLVDNAVDFSRDADEISVSLETRDRLHRISVANPGKPLPEKMRHRLFDSMVSMRAESAGDHLGLGLYIARLIAEGHGGTISAENIADGVVFHVHLPVS